MIWNADATHTAALWAFWLSLAALAAAYAGYPLFLILIDPLRLRRRPAIGNEPHEPSVTLLIPARNEAAHIQNKIANALSLDYPSDKLEILAIDDASEDDTAALAGEAAAGDARVRVVRREKSCGKAGALNEGVARARGEIVVFSDADSAIGPQSLRYLVQPFVNPIVGCVAGRYFPGGATGRNADGLGLYWHYENYIRRKESQVGGMLGASGALFAIRRSLYEPLGPGLINDDFVIPMRITAAGYRALYEPRATAIEDESKNETLEFGRRVRIMAGNWQHLWLFRGMLLRPRLWRTALQVLWHKGLRVLSPFFLIVAMVSNVALAAMRPHPWPYAASLFAQAALYLLAWAGGRGLGGKAGALAHYFVLINAAALAGAWVFWAGGGAVSWHKGPSARACDGQGGAGCDC